MEYLQLREVRKEFPSVLDDNGTLRNMVISKYPTIVLKKGINIKPVLENFYNQVDAILEDNYPREDAPKWVVYDEFAKVKRRSIIESFIDLFVDQDLIDYFDGEIGKFTKKNFKTNISGYDIAFGYTSSNFSYDNVDMDIRDYNDAGIKITSDIVEYFETPLAKILFHSKISSAREKIENMLYALLLINKPQYSISKGQPTNEDDGIAEISRSDDTD